MSEERTPAGGGQSESRVRVRYAETDQMGVVYHANYLVWFEVGRVDFIRQMGLDYRAMEQEEGALIAVVEVKARYKAPARYDDELIVRTRLGGVRGSIVRFAYAVVRAVDEVVLCEGETVHVVVGRDMRRRAMPARYAARFRAVLEGTPGDALSGAPAFVEPTLTGFAGKDGAPDVGGNSGEKQVLRSAQDDKLGEVG